MVATDIVRGAHAVERLVQRIPISGANADDARAALHLAQDARELFTENEALHRRVAFLEANSPASWIYSEPESHLWTLRNGRAVRYAWFRGPEDALNALGLLG